MKIPYIFSANSITVVVGGAPSIMTSDNLNYAALIDAIREDDEAEVTRLVAIPLADLSEVFGEIEVFGGHVTFQGETVHNHLVSQILSFKSQSLPIAPLVAFMANVQLNPSRRATEDLYEWCEKGGLPITEDGCIVAYKIVNHDFMDTYSRTFDNTPGKRVQVARNKVDDNPDVTCSYGLHFCSAAYLPHYGPSDKKVVLVKVNPSDVVAFPKDYKLSKARCCGYDVLEEIDAATAATFFVNSGPIYGYGASLDDQPSSDADKALATREGFTVFYDDDADSWDRKDATGDTSDTYYNDEAEAWAAAAEVVREIQNRLDDVEDHLGIPNDDDLTNLVRISNIEANLARTPDKDDTLEDRLDRAETICGV